MAEGDAQQAMKYFREAYQRQSDGDYHGAIEFYTRSIETYPSAEAYTFRGWAHSLLEEYDQAITDCMQAIQIDPDFGNPYNDIGAYLIETGRPDEAIPWLEKATVAPRYEARCYPHYNLGRVYEARRDWKKAKECYANALAENKDYQAPATALRRLTAMFN